MLSYYFRLALRRLSQDYWLALLTVLIISLGVGAAGAITTLIHGVSGSFGGEHISTLRRVQLDPRPIARRNDSSSASLVGLSWPDAQALSFALKGHAKTTMIGGNWLPATVEGHSALSMNTVQAVESNFFELFSVPIQYGSPWSASDDDSHTPVVVISHEANVRLFTGGDSTGRLLDIDGTTFRVIGVLAKWDVKPRFYYLGSDPYSEPKDFFMPLSTWIDLPRGYGYGPMSCWNGSDDSGFNDPKNSDCGWIQFWAAPAPGTSQETLSSLIRYFASDLSKSGRLPSANDWTISNVDDWLDSQKLYPKIVRLQAFLSGAILLACLITASGLITAKFARRRRELALRRALGAGYGQVALQCLAEVTALSFVAALVSLLTTEVGMLVIRQQSASYAKMAHFDETMLIAIPLFAVFVTLISAAFPIARVARRSLFSEISA